MISEATLPTTEEGNEWFGKLDANREVPGGFIAMVNRDSSEKEQRAVCEFSKEHHYGLCSESEPFLKMSLFEEPWEWSYWHCNVFAAVVDGEMVGYAKFFWGRSRFENTRGQVLGHDRTPLPPDKVKPQHPTQIKSMTGEELLIKLQEGSLEFEDEDANYPYYLKTWYGAGIGVLPEFQKRGIGTALVRTASECLETKLEHMAYTLTTDDGQALLRSVGVTDETIIWHPYGGG